MAQKKPLDHTVYDSWKSISNIKVTHDGKYSVAVVREQEGDSYLLIKDLKSFKELILPRGYTYSITPDQKQVISLIKSPYAATRQAKIRKTADEKMPKDSLAIISLADFNVIKLPNVKSYKIGKDYSDYLAYTIDDSLKQKDKKDVKARTLILRNLHSAKEDTLKNITEYVFSNNGKTFGAFVKANPKDSLSKHGVMYMDLANNNRKIISEGKTIYKSLAASELGNRLAFLATGDSLKKEIKDYSLYYY